MMSKIMNFEHPFNGWLSQLVRIQGKSQIANYVAVVEGIRIAMDDWVAIKNFSTFRSFISSLGLTYAIDCIFEPLRSNDNVFGLRVAPTTHAKGKLYDEKSINKVSENASIHVFIAKNKELAERALLSGWYPLVINNRVIHKPQIDHKKLGLAFGYPVCCINFFMKHNDWGKKNNIIDSLCVSKYIYWQVNSLLRYTPFMLNFHSPCNFDCSISFQLGQSIFDTLEKIDSRYSKILKFILTLPILYFSEHMAFIFDQYKIIDKNRIKYNVVDLIRSEGNMFIDNRIRNMLKTLNQADEIIVNDYFIHALYKGKLIDTLLPMCDNNVVEIPRIIFFQ